MKSKIISSSLLIAGFLIGASALSAVAAWTAPQSTPPDCITGQPGCDAPLHVGSLLQTKTGPLQLNWLSNGFAAIGLQLNGKIQINDAGPDVNTIGAVLTNEGGGVGTWKALPASTTSTTPAGLLVGGYVKSINQQVTSQIYIVDSWGVATGTGCSATYRSVHTGNKMNTSSASAGNFVHEVYVCLTK